MIRAKELRIGNLILFKGKEFIVTGFVISYLEYAEKHIADHEHKPTPLTEEWLLRFGCKKWDERSWKTPNNLYFIFREDEGVFVMVFGNKLVEKKYVHEFQNIVYDSGEELEIK